MRPATVAVRAGLGAGLEAGVLLGQPGRGRVRLVAVRDAWALGWRGGVVHRRQRSALRSKMSRRPWSVSHGSRCSMEVVYGEIVAASPPVARILQGAELVGHAGADAVDLAGEPVDRARLERVDGVAADDVAGLRQLHPAERVGPLVQRVEADVDAGRDRAAQQLAVGRHRVVGRGGAEVDHDHRSAVEVDGGHRVGDPVGADLTRVVGEHRHPGLHAGLDHDRTEAEVALGHVAERGGGAGHDRRDRDAVDVVVEREAVEAQELLHHQRVLVRRPLRVGGDPPVVEQALLAAAGPGRDAVPVGLLAEEPDDGLGVADVDGQQHGETR